MSTVFILGQTDVTLYFKAWTESTGLAVTNLDFDTTDLAISYVRERENAVTAQEGESTAPVNIAANSAHTDWGFSPVVRNLYRVDFPDAASAATGSPKFWTADVSAPGVTFVLAAGADLTASDPRAAAVTTSAIATAVVEDAAFTTVDTNIDTLLTRVTAAVATASDLATVDGNVDTLVSRVTAAVATASALTTVDNEIAAIQSDVTAIKNKTDDLTFTVAGVVDANATHMNDAAVTGNGTSGNLWRGA